VIGDPKRGGGKFVWFFDLDNTLHDATHAIFREIDSRMTDYVERHLVVDRAEANRLRELYWRRYGATLLGLVRHHAVNPHHFLRETHDFDVTEMLRTERGLVRLLARLPGRKVLLTNAPNAYSGAVLRKLQLDRHFGAQYSIERMRVHRAFRPKPSRLMLRAVLARERVPQGRAVLVEDSRPNLKAARSLGFRTVLLTRHSSLRMQAGGRRARPGYVDLRIGSMHRLPRHLARLRRR